MLTFTLGGASGLINASYTVNLVVHNTAWIPGHFHLTVGTAVALSFIGISYWLLPHLTGRELWAPRLAVAQTWLWTIGVLIMSRGLMMAGLLNAPRRTAMAESTYYELQPAWVMPGMWTAVGGTIMFIGGALFILIVVMSVAFSRRMATPPCQPSTPSATAASGEA
jgi:cytochrome c oxidase subunit 1